MPPADGSPEALIAALAGAGSSTGGGWMRLAEGLPVGADPVQWLAGMIPDGARLAKLQAAYVEDQAKLWVSLLTGRPTESVVGSEPGDRRFAAKEWRENPYYDYLRQSYLLAARYLNELADGVQLQTQAKERVRFAVKQWLDAISPTNFAGTNPEALHLFLESHGQSLTQGLSNLIADLRKGSISQSNEAAFELGRDLALTPGDVVHENDLMQLLQYAPTTLQVGKRPLIMVPPFINKYYILDLRPENSFVRYAVEQGHTVFMISWRNVGPRQGHYRWDDYLEQGVLEALRAAREIKGADRVNALGFCVGGTLLGAALAVLAAKGEALVESATYLTTLLDYAEPGQLGLFVDHASVTAREAAIGSGGLLPGAELAFVFSVLRARDLIWPYVVDNYLMGRSPQPFDLLHWNADSTNLPGPMYCYYVRNTYLENKLRVRGALVNCGVPVDLGKVDVPSFVLATREDHIVPWRAAYASQRLLGGEKTFVLGASGHVAGVINPPAKKRRRFWAGEPYPEQADVWLGQAKEYPGSWWPRWVDWLAPHRGGLQKAPVRTGNRRYRPREPAPGRFVRARASHLPPGCGTT